MARMLQVKDLQKNGMGRWEISHFLCKNLIRCSKSFCVSAMLEKELYAAMS